MSQVENGIRSILSSPVIYNKLQNIMGAKSVRTSFIKDHVIPHPNDNILDIGCGTADILTYLPEGINYFGFDQSQSYIEHAHKKFGSRGTFKCALVDSMITKQLPKMNIVLASGLIHHLDDEQTVTLLQTAKNALGNGGRFIAIDPCYIKGQSAIAKWLIDRDRGENVRNQANYNRLAKQVFNHVDSDVIHRRWIPYTHHILTCSI